MRLRQGEDQELMELELQLDGLQQVLKKNEAYSNKLRCSLAKIESRHSQNRERLLNLQAKKQDHKKIEKTAGKGGYEQQRIGLNSHKIQGISFYSSENYERLDCVQAFELMNKKKNKDIQLPFYQSYQTKYLSDKLIKHFESFFASMKKDTAFQIKKEFLKLVILIVLNSKNISHLEIPKASSSLQQKEFFNLPNEKIDFIELAEVANSILSHFQNIEISQIDGIEIFQIFTCLKVSEQAIPSKIGKKSSKEQLLPSWIKEEDDTLRRAVGVFGEKRWGQVVTLLNGKESTDIVQRWQKQLNPSVLKGRWSLREDLKLVVLYEFYEKGDRKLSEDSKVWCLIAQKFTSRTEVQIRERWCNLLNPALKFTHWSSEEDQKLLSMGKVMNGQWSKISRKLENKTDNQVLRRWKLLLSDKHNLILIKQLNLNNKIRRNISQPYQFMNNIEEKEEEISITKQPLKIKSKLFKTPIFQLIQLSPCLANQIRKDNLLRNSENKKYKKKKFSKIIENKVMKQNINSNLLTHNSPLDNSITYKSHQICQEEEDDFELEEQSHSSVSFTDYHSTLQNDYSTIPSSSLVKSKFNHQTTAASAVQNLLNFTSLLEDTTSVN